MDSQDNEKRQRTLKYNAESELRLLVCIASYGSSNDQYLARLLAEYRSMPYSTHIVVLSNAPKELGDDIEVRVGLPQRNPWSLPFGHKPIFAERLDQYDLFIYSENDTLVTHHNIRAVLRVSEVLPDNELAGFFRYEVASDGTLCYPDVHLAYHWDSQSVESRGGYTFASFNNEHAACYILTRDQLRRAILSGGYLVGPHEGKYNLPETAATDPYTGCGFTKRICISHLADFLVHHLPNKYTVSLALSDDQFSRQREALLRIGMEGNIAAPLLAEHARLRATRYGKNYYEPIRTDLIDLIPDDACSVLSVGCGWGATEAHLAKCGKRLLAVPLDGVISACAEARGVEVVKGDLTVALSRLSGQKFDCVLVSNVLHLLDDPGGVVSSLVQLLSEEAIVITTVPNLLTLSVLWRKLKRLESYQHLGSYTKSGVHLTSRWMLRKWLRQGGLKVKRVIDVLPGGVGNRRDRGGFLRAMRSCEIVAVAAKV